MPRGPENLRKGDLLLPGYEQMHRIKESSGQFAIPVGGHWVEMDVLRIAEKVEEYSQGQCRVWSCTCGRCLDHPDVMQRHYPHKVVEVLPDGGLADVFGFSEFGDHVVHHLIAIDRQLADPWEVQAQEDAKVKKRVEAERREAQREALDAIETALKSRKIHWKGPDGLYADPYGGGRVRV